MLTELQKNFLKGKRNMICCLVFILLIVLCFLIIPSLASSSVVLPTPQKESDVLLDDVLSSKFSTQGREKINESFDLNSISQLVWAAQGITHPPSRTVPSAGATYPLDVFISTRITLEHLDNGTYVFNPTDHSLIRSDVQPTYMSILQVIISDNNHLSLELINSAPVLFLITAEYERTTEKYGNRGIRYVHLEIGHLLQNLRIQAKALFIELEIVLNFDENLLQSLYGIEYIPLAVVFAWETDSADLHLNKKLNCNSYNNLKLEYYNFGVQTSTSVEEAINARRSIRDYLPDAIKETEIKHLLKHSINQIDAQSNESVFNPLLGNSSIGAYLSVSNVEGIEEGVYRYISADQSLNQIINNSKQEELWEASLKQQWVLDATVVIVLFMNQSKLYENNETYEFNYRNALFDIGAAAQNLYLESYALGLGMVVVGAFSDTEIKSIITALSEESPIYVIPVGKVSVITAYGPFGTWKQMITSISAWLSISGMYFAHLFITPMIRKKIKSKRSVRLHISLVLLSILFLIVHLFLDHGGWTFLRNPTWVSFWGVIKSIFFNFSLKGELDPYNVGFIISRLAIWFGIFFLALSLALLFRKTRLKFGSKIKIIHKYFGYTLVIMIIYHALINGVIVSYIYPWGVIVLVFAALSYAFLTLYPRLRKVKIFTK
ncbi:MAG: SagB/ThcOx family dehydrogenase [Candidatus Heimdallarchaeota archaeon]|nr:SagB/ThcOx family dehydrogenase [Candidatus Heimdallarchaeota archaeon]